MISPQQFENLAHVLPILNHADPELLREFQQKAFYARIPVGRDVFIEGDLELIVPYEVKLGMRSGDGFFEVLSGLKKGERVVTSANFLVDSESALKAAFKSASTELNK